VVATLVLYGWVLIILQLRLVFPTKFLLKLIPTVFYWEHPFFAMSRLIFFSLLLAFIECAYSFLVEGVVSLFWVMELTKQQVWATSSR
jgi:hypothetical protein